ncbi:MAG TPA: hypothetical protein VGE93_07195, partial [Bryobacteraceae bacterium]
IDAVLRSAPRRRSTAPTIKALHKAPSEHFFVGPVFVCLGSSDKRIQRVHDIVAQGATLFPTTNVPSRMPPEAERLSSNLPKV